MLDSAQMKAGKFKKHFKEFNVSQMVQKVINMQKLDAEKKGIDLCFDNNTYDDALVINSDE